MGWVFVYVIKNLKKQEGGKNIAQPLVGGRHGRKDIHENKTKAYKF